MGTSYKGGLGKYFDGFVKGFTQEQPRFELLEAQQLVAEFNVYMDMLASANPHRFHHIYEWDQCGEAGGRLFDVTAVPSGRGVIIQYVLLPSTTPNRNGQVFTNKAMVMESGDWVISEPEGPVYIESIGEFRVGPFILKPGGPDTTGAFQETWRTFFMTRIPVMTAKKIVPSAYTAQGGYNDARRVYDSIRIK